MIIARALAADAWRWARHVISYEDDYRSTSPRLISCDLRGQELWVFAAGSWRRNTLGR